MLRRLYDLHRHGKMPKENGANLKKLVLGYETLCTKDRTALLDTFLESFANENLFGFKPEIKELSKLYLKELQR